MHAGLIGFVTCGSAVAAVSIIDAAVDVLLPRQLGYLPTPTRGAAASKLMQAAAAARELLGVASWKLTFTSWPGLADMPDSLKVPVGVKA